MARELGEWVLSVAIVVIFFSAVFTYSCTDVGYDGATKYSYCIGADPTKDPGYLGHDYTIFGLTWSDYPNATTIVKNSAEYWARADKEYAEEREEHYKHCGESGPCAYPKTPAPAKVWRLDGDHYVRN